MKKQKSGRVVKRPAERVNKRGYRMVRALPMAIGAHARVIVTYCDHFGELNANGVFPVRWCTKCEEYHSLLDFLWVEGLRKPWTGSTITDENQVISTHDSWCYRHCGQDGQGPHALIRFQGEPDHLHLRFDLCDDRGNRILWLDPLDKVWKAWIRRGTRNMGKKKDGNWEFRFQPYERRSLNRDGESFEEAEKRIALEKVYTKEAMGILGEMFGVEEKGQKCQSTNTNVRSADINSRP